MTKDVKEVLSTGKSTFALSHFDSHGDHNVKLHFSWESDVSLAFYRYLCDVTAVSDIYVRH